MKSQNGGGWIWLKKRESEKRDVGMESGKSGGESAAIGNKEEFESSSCIGTERAQSKASLRKARFSEKHAKVRRTHKSTPSWSDERTWGTGNVERK
jgi:hypothetical protein